MSDTPSPAIQSPDPTHRQIEASMADAGVDPATRVQDDYFGVDETYQIIMPDGISYIECKEMSEGDRRKYQAAIQRDIRVLKSSGDAMLNMSTGEERKALIQAAAIGWNFKRAGQPVAFANDGTKGCTFAQWIDKAKPKVVDFVYKEISKHEPWTMSDMSSEQISEQIEQLQEMLDAKLKEEAGKDS